MKKTNTCKARTENSIRTKKRLKRGFKLSRPNRRAERRHSYALGAYQASCSTSGSSGVSAFTSPGAQKRW